MARSLYPYRNRPPLGLQALTALPQARIPCPAGYSDSPFELLPTPLGWVRSTMDDLRWTRVHGRGGHFFGEFGGRLVCAGAAAEGLNLCSTRAPHGVRRRHARLLLLHLASASGPPLRLLRAAVCQLLNSQSRPFALQSAGNRDLIHKARA
jgi:hypothetical protein